MARSDVHRSNLRPAVRTERRRVEVQKVKDDRSMPLRLAARYKLSIAYSMAASTVALVLHFVR